MDVKKKDRRVRRTEQRLEEALVVLLKKKNINEISVSELAETADITRATFYAHYRDPYEMLSYLQERILRKIITLINETTGRDPEKFFLSLFTYFKEEVSYPEILMFSNTEGTAFERMGDSILENYMRIWLEKTRTETKTEYMYYRSYTISGCIAVVKQWILGGREESVEYMTKLAMGFLPHTRMIRLRGKDV